MRTHRLFNLATIFIMVVLAACVPSAPAGPQTAPQAPSSSAAPTTSAPVQAPTTAPTPIPAPTATRAPLPPAVIGTTPARGEEAQLAAPIVITFDQPMDAAATGAAFSIEPKTPGEVKVQGAALTFRPAKPLARATQYRVALTGAATSATGLMLQQPVSFVFTTAGYLKVTSTQPADSAEDVAVDSPITVAFNRPVVPLTPVSEQAGLPQPLVITPTLAGKGEWINTSLYRFTPADGLAASTAYSVSVAAGLADPIGNMLAEPVTFGFRTADPTVVRWQPENQVNVKIESPISVTFSMPMDRPSTEAAFSLVDDAKTPVAGTFSWSADGTELGFKPSRVLKFGAAYIARVAPTAAAASGQGTVRKNNKLGFSFTTVELPRVKRTDPVAGLRTVAPEGGVRFEFASPMDRTTFISGTVTILPKPTQVYTYYNEYDNYLYLDFPKLPDTAYTVTLASKVADPYGNTLGKDYVLQFRTGDYEPILQLNGQTQVGTYNAYTETQAVVVYRNMPELRFSLYTVPEAEFLKLTGREFWAVWDSYRPKQSQLIREWSRAASAPRNKIGFVREPLVAPDGKPLPAGIYYLQLGGTQLAGQQPPRQLLVRTNLNVTIKTAGGQTLAWVTDLKTGQPVPGATVRFADNGGNDVRATADRDGVATAALPAARQTWDPLLAIATSAEGGFGVASSTWQDGISPWDFHLIGNTEQTPYAAYIYTDRPIYRPGQTVYWKAIIRRDDDARYTLPAAGQPITVTIADDQGNNLLQQKLALNPMGAVDGELALGPDAGLGYYYVSVQMDKEHAYGVNFQVAEYRKPEYELAAQADQPEYIQGQQINVTAQANYFFGGPVKNGKVRWTLMSADASFNYRGPDGYSFEDYDWFDYASSDSSAGQISQGEGRTDADGRVSFSAPADIAKFKRSQRFTFDITVEDLNGQAVSTQATAVVHKGDFYIGLKPRSYVLTAGDVGQVDVITVDPQSQPAPNTAVDLVVSRIEWMSVREKAEDGNTYWTTRPKKTGVYTSTVTTDAQGAALLEWQPTAAGEYKIEATARDRSGHTLRSAAYQWVSGREWTPWRVENNDRITLVADKSAYKVGETAKILVPSPYQGTVKALLTIERSGILEHRVIELAGNSATVEVPITAGYVPNIFVSLVLIKGMEGKTPPSFKMGLVALNVSTAEQQLQVIVTPRCGDAACDAAAGAAKFAPRDVVTWTVQTLDASGKPVPADVSLALVDKAVLTLADDMAGTLLDRFYAARGLGVQTASTLVLNVDRLIAQLAEGGKGGGGGGGAAGITEVRSDFADVAFWRASVTTDAQGRAEVAVRLPDNLTTWTMDARAVTKDTRVGQTQTSIIATKALLVRPVLPRFFVAGDRAEIAAVIHNTTDKPLDVAVSLAATGLDAPAQPKTTVKVPANDTTKVVWPVTVQADAAEVKVRMAAISADPAAPLQDAVEITLPVNRYTTPEVVGASGQISEDETRLELVRLAAGIDPTRGELAVTIEPSLAAGMTGGLTYLEHYPYECTEQTVSRFLPNVATYAALKKLGLSRPDLDPQLPQLVGVGLQRLYAKQHGDGGWGWWSADQSSPSITAYVVFSLAKAKQAGFTVDADVLARGVGYLTENLAAPADLQPWQLNQQAFMVYALAEAGRPEPNRAGALYEAREGLSTYGKAYLALALSLINDGAAPKRIETLLSDIGGRAITSATATHWEEGWTDTWNMNSDTRTTSIVLDALAKLAPKQPLAPNAVRWLMSARKADRWETTQENAWAIMALTDWMTATGELAGNYDWQVALNGQSLGAGTVTPQNVQETTALRADIAQLLADQTNGLTITRSAPAGETGKGQLYYTAHLKTYLPVEKVAPLNRGVSVSREYRLADCGLTDSRQTCPTITGAKVGDVIAVKLTVVVPNDMVYFIVEDPLPAGIEALDTSLKTTTKTVEGPQAEEVTAQTSPWPAWRWTPTHAELRDDKTVLFETHLAPGTYEFTYQARASLPGEYLTLPPTAYQMYFPEVWGRGAGSVFKVTE